MVELAEMLEVPQSNVAFWEQSEKPPRSDLLPKMADILGVEIVDSLNTNGRRVAAQRNSRPPVSYGKFLMMYRDCPDVSRSILSEFSRPSSCSTNRAGNEKLNRSSWALCQDDLRVNYGSKVNFWRQVRRIWGAGQQFSIRKSECFEHVN